MLKCDGCETEWVYSLRYEQGKGYCSQCLRSPVQSGHTVIEKEYLPEYGYVEKSRLRELERRVILGDKDSKNPTDYFVGRRNGSRIEDREPVY